MSEESERIAELERRIARQQALLDVVRRSLRNIVEWTPHWTEKKRADTIMAGVQRALDLFDDPDYATG